MGLIVPLKLALHMTEKPKHEYDGGCYVKSNKFYDVAEVGNFMHVTSLDEPINGGPVASLFRRGHHDSGLFATVICCS